MNSTITFIALLCAFFTISDVIAEQTKENGAPAPKVMGAEAKRSFRDTPLLEHAFIDTHPAAINDGISVGELGVDGGNKEMLVALAHEIADDRFGHHDSLLVAHKGKLLFESYFRKGRINLPHPQASTTKTYTSLALGRAIQMGHLTMDDLNKPIISFLDDLDPTKFVEGAELITLHNALTMTTGINITDEERSEFEKDTERLKGQGQVQVILETTSEITPESQSFLYGYGPDLVMQVINTKVPGGAEAFIKDQLLDKLDITNYRWRTSVSGLPQAGWGVSMTSRDMVKVGMLIANKGKWQGEQLIPKAFIERATSMVIDTGDDRIFGGGPDVSNQGYGYYMWNAELRNGSKRYYSASAQGGGGQFIILIDQLDLMIVVTASNRDPSTLQLTAEKILPAFIQ